MKNSFDPDFIRETKEKTPFADRAAQNFFGEWCRRNDSIVPRFITREAWEQKGIQGILEKNSQGKHTLFLPEDLHLWEIMEVIRTVDHDTLARKPEKRDERAEKIKELGKIFEKAGVYLAEYGPALGEGEEKHMAETIAREFYGYGLSLQQKGEDKLPQKPHLSPEDKIKQDEWFLGREAYQKRLAKLGESPTEEQRDAMRKRILKVYFKALAGEGYKTEGEKPWETKTGPMQRLQDRTKRQIMRALETPEREMNTAIFRRGIEKLVTEMKETVDMHDARTGKKTPGWKMPGWGTAETRFFDENGFYPWPEQKKLSDILHIDQLKDELNKARHTGDVAKISAKELKIAKKIQEAVRSFSYKEDANNPSEMVETQLINCVGSSMLGGGLLEEVGIKYIPVNVPDHSATVLVTNDGKAYWQDFTPGNLEGNFTEITPDIMTEKISFADCVKQPSSAITFSFKDWNPYFHVNGTLRVTLLNPETGLQCQFLNNLGAALRDLWRNEEAIEAYQQAIGIDPTYVDAYNGLGNAYYGLGRNKEAIEAYQKTIGIDPTYVEAYYNLGNAFSDLGRKDEAIEAYQEFIARWKGEKFWRERAEREIARLKGLTN